MLIRQSQPVGLVSRVLAVHAPNTATVAVSRPLRLSLENV